MSSRYFLSIIRYSTFQGSGAIMPAGAALQTRIMVGIQVSKPIMKIASWKGPADECVMESFINIKEGGPCRARYWLDICLGKTWAQPAPLQIGQRSPYSPKAPEPSQWGHFRAGWATSTLPSPPQTWHWSRKSPNFPVPSHHAQVSGAYWMTGMTMMDVLRKYWAGHTMSKHLPGSGPGPDTKGGFWP